ncbi:restriction endonuclease subunit S [Bacteroides ovatus]|nr:restriction endonuclease subunit S [Bacteroides ovatus]MDC2635675.1 restriction endonuclease subunit S [Bacteroides ovatus]
MIDLSKDKLPNIKEGNMPKNFELCKNGDIAFADASEDTNEVAKAVEFYDLDEKDVVCGLHTIHGRDNADRTVIGFKGYAFSSDTFHHQIRRIAQGTKVFSISTKNFSECYIGIPSKEEQTKIVTLLRLINERIATQNKIIEDLKKLKSAISLNLLHSETWEQFKIKDIAQIGRGRVISFIEISQQKNPTYPVYSSQTSNDGIMGYLDDYMFEGEYISWTTDGANAGTVFYRNGKFNCTNVCGLLKLRKEFDTHFVSLVLAEATKKYVSINLANPKLMNNTMGNIQIRLPKLDEQKRISIIFRKLQKLLTTHNSLLAEYTKQKQYLLSQMFI